MIHIRWVMDDSEQIAVGYALRLLRYHGMTETYIRLLPSGRRVAADVHVPASSGFTTPTRRRISQPQQAMRLLPTWPAKIRQTVRGGTEADDQLFERTLNNPYHTLHQLLPPQSTASQKYNLRRCTHDRQLHAHQGHLSDCNFIRGYCTKIHTNSKT